LFVINMIPVPPLDGSRFLKYALKMSDTAYASFARYGIFILLGILLIPQTSAIVTGIVRVIAALFVLVSELILGIIS